MSRSATIREIYRFPVKGLTPEPMAAAVLEPFRTIARDRAFAIENGPSGFDPAAPGYLPKQRFLMLMKNESLARLRTRLDEADDTLIIQRDGREVARGALGTASGRGAIEAFFARYCADELRGPPRVLVASDHSFSDVARKVVSIINLSSVAAIEQLIGRPVDPLRFRGNLYVTGWPAWAEFEQLGQEIRIGRNARAKIVKRIVRCPATDVDPTTGARDLDIPAILRGAFGHADCGVYAEVIEGGDIQAGDPIAVAEG